MRRPNLQNHNLNQRLTKPPLDQRPRFGARRRGDVALARLKAFEHV